MRLKVMSETKNPVLPSGKSNTRRRAFLTGMSGAAAVTIATQAMNLPSLSANEGSNGHQGGEGPQQRSQACFQIRLNAAQAELNAPPVSQVPNGDEARYPNRIGNFSKGLLHNSIGEVDPASYQSLLNALSSGNP